MASSHIILPKEEEEEMQVEADHNSPAQQPFQAPAGEAVPAATGKAASLPFSATCVRISRDSYPNLRALRNASAVSIHDDDAAFVKLDEGDFGYVLDDVQHFTDYIPDLPVS
jgi:6-phosphofructokinase 1